ncbi:MAG: hypothetical protein N2652_07130 [Kiritimatiellae bacterium]|nr:hypothetical protein [Kiritimatiellia bacterium]
MIANLGSGRAERPARRSPAESQYGDEQGVRMMTRRMTRWVALGVLAAGVAAAQELFVAPARYSVLQVLFDVLRFRPAGLVSYQGNAQTERPTLHAWTGEEWVPVSLEQFRDGSFASTRPARIALLGDAELLPPVLAEAAQKLAPVVVNWTNLDNAAVINAAGRWLKFRQSEWAWFAGRYRMQLADENAPRRRDSWYYHPHPELRRGLGLRGAGGPPPAPTAPVTLRAPEGPAAVSNPPATPATPPTVVAPNAMWEPPEPPPSAPAPRGVK